MFWQRLPAGDKDAAMRLVCWCITRDVRHSVGLITRSLGDKSEFESSVILSVLSLQDFVYNFAISGRMPVLMARVARTILCSALMYFAAFSGSFATEAPSFIEEPSDIIVQKNKPAQLNCSVKGDPKPTIEWRRNNAPLSLSNDLRRKILPDGSLYFSQIYHIKGDKPDEGRYECIAESRINNLEYVLVSRTAKLQVAGLSSKITVEVLPQPARVAQGDVARFLCVVRHAVPAPVIEWKKVGSNTMLQPSSKYFILPNGVLQIRDVQHPADAGEYQCIVTNPMSHRQHPSTHTRLDTLPDSGLPRKTKFIVNPANTNATQGESVVLECVANASPRPVIGWYKDDVAVVMDGRLSLVGGSNLQISSVSLSDAGSYKCKATSQNREEESEAAVLQVQYPPRFITRPRTSHAYENSDVRFDCVAEGIPKPVVSWRKNGEMQQSGAYIVIGDGYLTVKALVRADMGVYQCFVSNPLGNIQADVELVVYKKGAPIPEPLTSTVSTSLPTTTPTPQPQYPGPPQNVRARTLSDTEVEVSWSPPLDPHGKLLSYTVFYTLKDSSGGSIVLANTSGDSQQITISDLRPDSRYKFNVYARNKHGAGAISADAVSKTAASNEKPSAPKDVSADAESESSVRVTWSEPETGPDSVARYVISYSESPLDDFAQITTKEQTVVLRDLQTYTKYDIKVHAENKKGLKGPSQSVQVTTKSGVPKYPPGDFVLMPDNVGTGLIATWRPPNMVNGQITFYVIKFRRVGSSQANKTDAIGVSVAERQRHYMRGLLPDTEYEAKIAAGTEAGLGMFTSTWVRAKTRLAKCSESRVPGEPTNVETKVFDKVIQVKWNPPDDAGLICVTWYILQWGKLMPYEKSLTVPADAPTALLKELTPNQKYVIKIMAKNSAGNGLPAFTDVQTASGPPPPLPVEIVKVKPLSSKSMSVSWLDRSLLQSPVYHVYYSRPVADKLSYCGNTTRRVINCNGLQPYTEYRFYVRRNNDKVNATQKNRTMEDVPGPPVDLTGNPDEKDFSKLELHWQVPEITNGPIRFYMIYYSTDKSAPLKEWARVEVPGSQLITTIRSLTPQTKFYFKMKAKTRAGWGKLSDVKEIHTPPYSSTPKREPLPTVAVDSTAAENVSAAAVVAAADLKDKTLWISIAAVAGITLIAIIIISIILCKKRSADDIQRRPPPTYKSVIQSNGSMKKKGKDEKSPDLWVNHPENMELKTIESHNPPPDVTRNASVSEAPTDYIKLNASKTSFQSESDGEMAPEGFPTPPLPMKEAQRGFPGGLVVMSPDIDRPFPVLPTTSTPLCDKPIPRSGSLDNSVGSPICQPPQRSYDPTTKVPLYPAPPPSSPMQRSPPVTLPKPASKPPVTPVDDIQLPSVGFNNLPSGSRPNGVPNGLYSPPPKYDDVFAPSSPPKDNTLVSAELEMELAGLEGLLKDLDSIRGEDYQL